jgi:hypothetical protein
MISITHRNWPTEKAVSQVLKAAPIEFFNTIAPFQPLAALHPVQRWEDTKLLLVHALGHVRDLIPRSIRVIANGPLARKSPHDAG